MKLNYIVISAIIIAALGGYYWYKKSSALQSDTKNNGTDNGLFIVGTTAGYAPWVSINQSGEYEGFDVDVMHALAKQMGKKLEIKDLGSMPSLFIALNQNKIDAIIWGMSITQSRLEAVAMVKYQGDVENSYPLLFWEKIPDGVTSIAEMAEKTVCVEPASAQDAVLSKYPLIIKMPVEKVDDALLNIQYGKAAAALVEPAIAKKFKNKYPHIQTLDVPLDSEDQVQGVGICIQKNKNALIEQVTEAVNVLRENGTIAEFEKKWNIA